MFGSLGGPELLLILVLALLLFGPRKLPEIGRTIGRGLSEFRKATTEFKSSLQREVELDDVKQTRDDVESARREIRRSITDAGRSALGGDAEPPAAPSRNTDNPPASTSGEPPPSDARERSEP